MTYVDLNKVSDGTTRKVRHTFSISYLSKIVLVHMHMLYCLNRNVRQEMVRFTKLTNDFFFLFCIIVFIFIYIFLYLFIYLLPCLQRNSQKKLPTQVLTIRLKPIPTPRQSMQGF